MNYFENDLKSLHEGLVNKDFSAEELAKETFETIKKREEKIWCIPGVLCVRHAPYFHFVSVKISCKSLSVQATISASPSFPGAS